MSRTWARNGCAHFTTYEPGRVLLAADREVRLRPVDLDAGGDQDVDELGRGQEVGLVGGNDVAAGVALRRVAEELLERSGRPIALRGRDHLRRHGPAIPVPALDGVLAHEPDVVQELLAMPRGVVEDRLVGGHRVIDRLPEVPLLRRHRARGSRPAAIACAGLNGMRIGVGLPMVSVSRPIMLWK